jgi:hypothetical protein
VTDLWIAGDACPSAVISYTDDSCQWSCQWLRVSMQLPGSRSDIAPIIFVVLDCHVREMKCLVAIGWLVLVGLQNKSPQPPFSIKDQKEALLMLAHFVGDLHQPLHVGAIYLDAAGNQVSPDAGTFDKNSATAGGNFISESHRNLHADWDAIPKRFGNRADKGMVAKAKAVPHAAGPLEDWAATWASDTVMAAHTAFKGLSFRGAGVHKWSVQFDDRKAYVKSENQLKEKQLVKAGARLAELLNTIWP